MPADSLTLWQNYTAIDKDNKDAVKGANEMCLLCV